LFEPLQHLFKRRLYDNTVELGLEILDDADVAYDHVEHFPLALNVMQSVIDILTWDYLLKRRKQPP